MLYSRKKASNPDQAKKEIFSESINKFFCKSRSHIEWFSFATTILSQFKNDFSPIETLTESKLLDREIDLEDEDEEIDFEEE